MFRKMKVAVFACAMVGLLAASQSAHAQIWDTDWAVTTPSTLKLTITPTYTGIALGAKSANVTVTGTLDSQINQSASTFEINSADMALSNFTLNWNIFIATLKLQGTGVKLGWESDPLGYSGSALNLGGSELGLNAGVLAITGGGLASDVNETIDLNTDPVSFGLPDPTNSTLNIVDLSVPNATWAIPINVDQTETIYEDDGVTVMATVRLQLAGTINLTATNSVLVPEPSSLLLAGISAVGLTYVGRKRYKNRGRRIA